MTPKKAYYFMLALVLATTTTVITSIYFVDSYLVEKSHNIAKLKAESDVLDETLSHANFAQQKLEELSFVKDVAEKVLPAEKTQSNLIGELTSYAEQAGMQVEGITFTTPGEEESESGSKKKNQQQEEDIDFNTSQTIKLEGMEDVRVFPFTFSVEKTNGRQLIDFLKLVETNRRKIRVIGISESTELSDGVPTGLISVTLSMQVYVRGEL